MKSMNHSTNLSASITALPALALALGLAAWPAPSIAADSAAKDCKPIMLQASEMKWTDSPALAKGLQVAILYGDMFDKALLKELPLGSVFIFPSGCPMFGIAREETVIQVNAEGPWGSITSIPRTIPGRSDRVAAEGTGRHQAS